MRWYQEELPNTDGELYDQLQRLFGMGAYDEVSRRDVDWYQARMRQVVRIKRLRKRRQLAVHQLGLAAYYCRVNHIHIRNAEHLAGYVKNATVAARTAARTDETADLLRRVDSAVAYEQENHPAELWADRLVAASDKEAVLEQWGNARHFTLGDPG